MNKTLGANFKSDASKEGIDKESTTAIGAMVKDQHRPKLQPPRSPQAKTATAYLKLTHMTPRSRGTTTGRPKTRRRRDGYRQDDTSTNVEQVMHIVSSTPPPRPQRLNPLARGYVLTPPSQVQGENPPTPVGRAATTGNMLVHNTRLE
ncbi:hypothetical protein BRADI_1g24553v3 [Brachypodium distachyon]|uniref:Uncharacterized protein n=1 Tax=Brachypodium distachyon TaxID=15368 RepID=A0A2K2DKX2_BRADI|nr:hypothetical protein BRADI_1g24553v3 [Brachypodium distachyon]